MQYLKDHQEYLELGGICDSAAFNRNIDRACGIIDNATYNRIECMTEVPQRAKALCRDLVEYLATNNNVGEKDVSSWSEATGPLSESISYVQKSKEDIQSEIDELVYQYLGSENNDNGTPLLYRGCGI